MNKKKYYIYTDASYSHKEALGVSGYLIFTSEFTHELSEITELSIKTDVFKESNNIRAELCGAINVLKIFIETQKKEKCCFSSLEINLYTDCKSLTNLLARRKKLELTGYIGSSKKTILSNADLYKIFFLIYDDLKPIIHWVKGHSSKASQTLVQRNFQIIDKHVRKELRTYVDQIKKV